ncbi:unnamed protein product [Peniophora sp. CBMAI 1063]|nr:unnamed protein product [Peniophora sp. CBMAI 1063]
MTGIRTAEEDLNGGVMRDVSDEPAKAGPAKAGPAPTTGRIPVQTIQGRVDFRRLLRLAGQLASRTPLNIVDTLPDRGASSPKALPFSFAPAPAATPMRITRRYAAQTSPNALKPFLKNVNRAIASLKWYGGHRRLACHEDVSCAAASHGDDDEADSVLAANNLFAPLLCAVDEAVDESWALDPLSPHPSEPSPSETFPYEVPSTLTALASSPESHLSEAVRHSANPRQPCLSQGNAPSYADVLVGRCSAHVQSLRAPGRAG